MCPFDPHMLQDLVPRRLLRCARSAAAFGFTSGHVLRLWPLCPQCPHSLWPLRRFLRIALSGLSIGQVRVLCPILLHSAQRRRLPCLRFGFTIRLGLTTGQVRVLCPMSPHPRHWRLPLLRILFLSSLSFAAAGFNSSQVRELWSLAPQWEHCRVPRPRSLDNLLLAAIGLIFGHVRVLWPDSPQCEQILPLPRLDNLAAARAAASGLATGQVRILCPRFPQPPHTLRLAIRIEKRR